MSFSDFKKDAKGKLDNYRPEIDAEALWTQLEPQVQKKKDKKRFFFWLFFSSLGFGIAAFGWWYTLPATSVPSTVPVSKQAIDIAQKKLAHTINPTSTLLEKTKKETKNQEQLTTNTSKQNSKNSIPVIPNSKNISTNFPPKGTTKNIIKTPTTPNLVLQEKNTEFPKVIQPSTQAKEENKKLSDKNLASLSIFDQLALKKISFPLFATAKPTPLILANPKLENQEKIVAIKNKWQWTLGLHIGAGRLDQILNLKDPEDQAYFATRLKTENTLESLQSALDIQLRHRSGLYFQTGLEYARMATRFQQKTETIEDKFLSNGIQRIYTNNATGDTSYVYGSVPQQSTLESTKTRYNSFYTLNIPLLLGYRLEQKSWSFGIEAGVLVNAYLKKSGNIADFRTGLYSISDDELNWFKTNLGIRPMAAIHAGYRIRSDWEIYLSPQYRFPVKVSTAESFIDQSFSSLGVVAGVRFNL